MDRALIDEYLDDVRRQAVRVAMQADTIRGLPRGTSEALMLDTARRLAAEAVHLGDDIKVIAPEVSPRPPWKQALRRIAGFLWRLSS